MHINGMVLEIFVPSLVEFFSELCSTSDICKTFLSIFTKFEQHHGINGEKRCDIKI